MRKTADVEGRTMSREAMYRWNYALPRGELSSTGILTQSNRTKLGSVTPLGERTGSPIVGNGGKSTVANLVELHSGFLIMLGLPEGATLATSTRTD